MDHNFTKMLQDWLNQPREQRDVQAGATMLLQLNRNKILFQNIIRKPEQMMDKLEYELKKHLRIRLDKMTVDDVVRMERELVPKVDKMLEQNAPVISTDNDAPTAKVARGKRPDHDSLPLEIQALYVTNGDRYFKIKQLFNQLKGMQDAAPCDRYEYLKQLADLDKQYHKAWEQYDSYVPGTSVHPTQVAKPVNSPDDIAKRVSAARKFISTNKPKLMALKESDKEQFGILLSKMQQRVDELQTLGSTLSESVVIELKQLGINF